MGTYSGSGASTCVACDVPAGTTCLSGTPSLGPIGYFCRGGSALPEPCACSPGSYCLVNSVDGRCFACPEGQILIACLLCSLSQDRSVSAVSFRQRSAIFLRAFTARLAGATARGLLVRQASFALEALQLRRRVPLAASAQCKVLVFLRIVSLVLLENSIHPLGKRFVKNAQRFALRAFHFHHSPSQGSYSATPGAASCTACLEGTFLATAGVSTASCSSCGPGKFNEAQGQAQCQLWYGRM